MDELLIVVLVIYIIVGAVVYFVTDTTTLASGIESATGQHIGLTIANRVRGGNKQ